MSAHKQNSESFGQFVKRHLDNDKSELESLRAERDGLVEALREIKDSAMMPDSVLNLVEQTLTKYEK